jgi:hypothetical protein
METTTRKKDLGQAGNGGEFGARKRAESDLALTPIPPKFTPMSADGRFRLDVASADIEVVSGEPFTSRRGVQGRIRIKSELFDVKGKPCGARCYCDAQLVKVPDEGLEVENGHKSFRELGTSNHYGTWSLASKTCHEETFWELDRLGSIEPDVLYVIENDDDNYYAVTSPKGERRFYDHEETALRARAAGNWDENHPE